MGTKNNPGKFDCHDKAEPDEPMFVLLGRDPVASVVVSFWIALRRKNGDTDEEKLQEAMSCARDLERWARDRGKIKEGAFAALADTMAEVAAGMSDRAKLIKMIKGLVRYAELREADESKGVIWDDKSREALALARECGWGKDRTGRLP